MVLPRQMFHTVYSSHFPIWPPRKHNNSNNSRTCDLNTYIIGTNFDDKKEIYHLVYCKIYSLIIYGGKQKAAKVKVT